MEPFTLQNDPPAPSRQPEPEPVERMTQRTLFSGLDCLPGQLDLFATDGALEDPSPLP